VLQWEKEHPEAKAWIYRPDSLLKQNFDRWQFDDYLGNMKTCIRLVRRYLIDSKISYDFFSYTIETIYEANNFE